MRLAAPGRGLKRAAKNSQSAAAAATFELFKEVVCHYLHSLGLSRAPLAYNTNTGKGLREPN